MNLQNITLSFAGVACMALSACESGNTGNTAVEVTPTGVSTPTTILDPFITTGLAVTAEFPNISGYHTNTNNSSLIDINMNQLDGLSFDNDDFKARLANLRRSDQFDSEKENGIVELSTPSLVPGRGYSLTPNGITNMNISGDTMVSAMMMAAELQAGVHKLDLSFNYDLPGDSAFDDPGKLALVVLSEQADQSFELALDFFDSYSFDEVGDNNVVNINTNITLNAPAKIALVIKDNWGEEPDLRVYLNSLNIARLSSSEQYSHSLFGDDYAVITDDKINFNNFYIKTDMLENQVGSAQLTVPVSILGTGESNNNQHQGLKIWTATAANEGGAASLGNDGYIVGDEYSWGSDYQFFDQNQQASVQFNALYGTRYLWQDNQSYSYVDADENAFEIQITDNVWFLNDEEISINNTIGDHSIFSTQVNLETQSGEYKLILGFNITENSERILLVEYPDNTLHLWK